MALDADNTGEIAINGKRLPTMGAYAMPVAVIVLDAGGVDFLIESLPHDDGMTRDLVKLRERAKDTLWIHEAS